MVAWVTTAADTDQISATVARAVHLQTHPSDACGISETVAQAIGLHRTDTDQISETVAKAISSQLGPADVDFIAEVVFRRTHTSTNTYVGVVPADAAPISEVTARVVRLHPAQTDTALISETAMYTIGTRRTDSVLISETIAKATSTGRADTASISETVGVGTGVQVVDAVLISEIVAAHLASPSFSEVIGITDSLSITGALIQYDTWRPITKPDNTLMMMCRTPIGEHDTYTGLTHLQLWTISLRGTGEQVAVQNPALNGFGWVSYGHPEWSPDGHSLMVWVETSTHYQLMEIDADGFGR